MGESSINGILDQLDALADERDTVHVGDVMERLGQRGAGVLILVPALIGISPIGGIPTVPSITALIVLLLAGQILWGRDHLWLPGVLEDRGVSNDRLAKSVARMRRPANWVDRNFGKRLTRFTGAGARRAAMAACCVLALTIPPLEIVPWGVVIPMSAVLLFGFAMTLDDGIVMLLAFAAAIAALAGIWMVLPL